MLALAAMTFAPAAWLSDNGRIGWSEAVAASSVAAQNSSARGVTVKITPQNVDVGAKTWDFAVVLDTHSSDLGDDLVKSTVLLDGAGGRYSPVAWEGAPPGGHHREGVLRFKPVSPQPQSIELQITRPGEDAPRSFRWELR
jgi:hypothetical protein